jgi:hypothetical protein
MTAVFRAARGGLGGRKLQAVIIGLVVLVATAASTLALGMLADAHSPFDHAFASQNGADVAVAVDTSVASAARISAATKVNSGLPASLISIYSAPEMVILALAGLVIAIAGALVPASWAANSRTATALRTE